MTLKIAFRVDASIKIGTGHVIRCLTLAKALHDTGVECYFVCRELTGHLLNYISEQGFHLIKISCPDEVFNRNHHNNNASLPLHADWLECDWQTDAEQSSAALVDIQPDWLIVDHYALDARWEKKLDNCYKKLMVIDDLADRIHVCDILLDQNLIKEMELRYKDKVPKKCNLLLGIEYALLQPLYAELHKKVQLKKRSVKHILIYFGGIDQYNFTGRLLSIFNKLNYLDIKVDIVISSKSPQLVTIRKQILNNDNIHIYMDLPSLAPLMLKADLAIGAGGATSWERLCLGLPALVISLAENQRHVTSYLHSLGLIKWIGHFDEIDDQKIADALEYVLSMPDLMDWSKRCLALCSGEGLSKVVDRLTS